MPPKAKITKDMVVDAAFDIVRMEGETKITARHISEQLKCSTQPVLYYFSTVEEIRKAVYQKVDAYHTDYIMNLNGCLENPMLMIGINYIRFAKEESNLFRFLFQSNEFSGASIADLIASEELLPIISVFQQKMGVSLSEAKEIFHTLFIYIHGYASLYANNAMVYDEKKLITTLTKVLHGAVYVAKESNNEEII